MSQLLDPNSQQLEEWLSEHDQPGFRARQVRRWLAAGRASSFADMTDLPAELRDQLQQQLLIWSAKIQAHRKAKDGTEKLLLDFDAGGQIECVLLRDGARRTICISSQVGCAMDCSFCSTGKQGLSRNLTAAEMDTYRAPYLDPPSRKPLWRWPNEIPLDGEPADVAEVVQAYADWLQRSDVPKLLLYATPGAILRADMVAWCREHIQSLTCVDIGPGLHFVQEDQPHAIGRALRTWFGEL